ncbi:hypothetical protein VTJ49DRAFT_2934 [Mycothermus thermophilus]|uniref:Oxidoreductase-like domain-containing protein n=1 Tax=Humicola insolens TaxID=85995 RepID=A0ABR3V926_HUMIN
MRRALLSANPARILSRGMASHGAPRPVVPIIASNPSDQIHPVGPFYESIMRSKLPSHSKTEAPPVTAKPAVPPKPTPAPKQAEKAPEPPKQAEKPAEKVAEPAAKTEESAPEEKKRAGRPRKTKADKDEPTTNSSKAKSVPPPPPPPSPSTTTTTTTTTTQSSSHGLTPPLPPSSSEPIPPQQEDGPPSNRSSQTRGGIVFGSRLAGPGMSGEDEYRQSLLRASRSRVIAGVRVPPKPDEPDNCCMSGCVDCVWDRYRDEMEEWAAATAEVERRLGRTAESGRRVREGEEVSEEVGVTEASAEAVERGKGMRMGVHEEVADREGGLGMEEDGGGVVEDWGKGEDRREKGGWDDELYKHLPVGIREFMKHEKRMKEKHLREGTAR